MSALTIERDALADDIRGFVAHCKAAGREPTDAEVTEYTGKHEKLTELNAKLARVEVNAQMMRTLATELPGKAVAVVDSDTPARSMGEHFVKHGGARLAQLKGQSGASVSVPEFKAASDSQYVGGLVPQTGTVGGLSFAEIDTSVVQGYRPLAVVSDLLGAGTLSSSAITYYIEGTAEGAFTTVAEGAAKPQLHYNFSLVTEALTKIAGYIKLSDEMVEDLAFLVSEINGRLLYNLMIFEEQQLLNGNGTAPNLRGLLNRSGIQTEVPATIGANVDSLFKAITKVQTGSGFAADGLVIHPTDYQTIRLSKDANNQYYGGGPFTGPYGVGGVPMNPPVWGLRTVVTTAIAAGTVLVGAFKQAATVYRKGGVRVESTNSNVDDFIKNLVTIRAEERLALACRVPAALVKVTLSATP